jgi:hypothetical protein
VAAFRKVDSMSAEISLLFCRTMARPFGRYVVGEGDVQRDTLSQHEMIVVCAVVRSLFFMLSGVICTL